MTTLHVEVPDSVLALPGYNQTELEHMAREALMVRLYAEGGIAAQQAARVLGITRDAFGTILAHYSALILCPSADLR